MSLNFSAFSEKKDTKKQTSKLNFTAFGGSEKKKPETYLDLFPTKQNVNRATFNIRAKESQQPELGTAAGARDFRSRTEDRPQTISSSNVASETPITDKFKTFVGKIPGESGFERSIQTAVSPRVQEIEKVLFPSVQSYVRRAYEENSSLPPEEIQEKTIELITKDGFQPVIDTKTGEITKLFSPLDSMGPVMGTAGRTYGAAKRGVRNAIQLLSKRFAGETEQTVIENTVSKSFPWMQPDEINLFSSMAAKTKEPERIQGLLEETVKRGQARLADEAPRVFSPDNVPTPAKGEQLAVFERTGGDIQYIFDNVDDAVSYVRKQGGNINNLEIGTVPRNIVNKVADDASGSREAVQTIPRNVADNVVQANRKIDQSIINENEIAKFVDDEVMPPKAPTPSTPEAVLGRTPPPLKTITKRETTFLKDKLQAAQSISKRAAVATRQNVKEIQNDLVSLVSDLPLEERGKFIATIKNIQTPAQLQRQLPKIQQRVDTALEKVAELDQKRALRKQTRQLINQKQLQNTEALRKSLELPSLNQMNVDQLRSFIRTLAEYKPGDRFLSQRVLETIDRTKFEGMKTKREVATAMAEQASRLSGKKVTVEEMNQLSVNWYDKFLYDTALARQNPYYNLVVNDTQAALMEGNVKFAMLENNLDELVDAARKSRKKKQGVKTRVGQVLVPTDDIVFKYMDSPQSVKDDLIEEMTQEEIQLVNFLQDQYKEAYEYLAKEDMINGKIEDYVTHIRRSGLEAFKEDGFLAAVKELFSQYKFDQAQLRILNDKTGQVVPLEKFFAFAQQRTGGLEPTKNISRAVKGYFMAYHRKQALDSIVPQLQAYAQVVTPIAKTKEGLEMNPELKDLMNRYLNTKRGRPATAIVTPGTPPDIIIRGLVSFTRLIDLGLSPISFVAAQVGEQYSTFVAQGTKAYALGQKRVLTPKGKRMTEKYQGFVGRSVFKEIFDSSKNFPDKVFTTMLSGFHYASVRANKQMLLGSITPEEWASETISPERLAELKLQAGRWRAMDSSASVVGSTAEGGAAMQYKGWAVPHISTTASNLRKLSTGEVPLNSQEGQETLRQAVVTGSAALLVYSYFQEEDNSAVGQLIEKSTREALSSIGALDPNFWLTRARSAQWLTDTVKALSQLVALEEYKTGEKAGTLKGDDALLRQFTPAPVRQARRAIEDSGEAEDDLGIGEIDIGEIDIGDIDLGDLDIGDIDIGDISI